MKLAGIVILVVGLIMTLYTGFNYVTREKVLEIGSLEVTADRDHEVNWQPYAGIIVMIVGAGVFYFSQKNPRTA
jgi:uncharacterized membrane protein